MMKQKAKITDIQISQLLNEIALMRGQMEYEKSQLLRKYASYDYRTKEWSKPFSEVYAEATKQELQSYNALSSQIDHNCRWLDELDRLYKSHLWSRFYLVVGNSNGHIHKDLACHSCYYDTQYAWLPELSGDSEAEAVEAEGEILCTFCFPSAPVAWCEGVGRRTKEARDAAQAVRDERQALKASKSLSMDGEPVKIRSAADRYLHSSHKTFKTYRAAELWVVEALVWEKTNLIFGEEYHGYGPDAYSPDNLSLVLNLMAEKKGWSVDEIVKPFADKVAKKVQEVREEYKLWLPTRKS